MSGSTQRQRWARAIKSPAFPAHLRSIKGTLLSLVDVASAAGELHVWRGQLVAATGLPPRTLNRHLSRAVEAGWLAHPDHGGRGRRSRYLLIIPPDSAPEVARYSVSERGDSGPLTRLLSPADSGPPGGPLNKDSASDSERGALNDQRGRRDDHDDSRADDGHRPNSQAGSDEEQPMNPVTSSSYDPATTDTDAPACRLCDQPLPRGLVLLGRSEHLTGTCPTAHDERGAA